MAIQDRLGLSGVSGGIASRLGKGNKPIQIGAPGGDARNTLIQKKRANIKDARDKLGQITKGKGDVRAILNKKAGQKQNIAGQNIRQLKNAQVDFDKLYQNLSPALAKKIRDVSQNQRQRQPQNLTTNSAKRATQFRTTGNRVTNNGVQKTSTTSVKNGSLVRTVKGTGRAQQDQNRGGQDRQPQRQQRTMGNDRSPVKMQRNNRPVIKELVTERRQMNARSSRPDPWDRQQQEQQQPQPRRMEYEVMAPRRPTYVQAAPEPAYITVDEWDAGNMRGQMYESNDFDYEPAPRKQVVLSQNIVHRLDEEPPRMQSYSQGYKIMVSNLQRAVTLEDVEELFGNIGPLSSVRMMQTGCAEVVFINKDDAYKAIEVYHYRLLDGQPMNVSVISTGGQQVVKRQPQPQQAVSRVYASNGQQVAKTFVRQSGGGGGGNRPTAKSVLRAASGGTRVQYVQKSSGQARVAPSMNAREALFERKRAYSPPNARPQVYSFGGFR